MTDKIIPPIPPVSRVPKVDPKTAPKNRSVTTGVGNFQELLEKQLGSSLKISAHAQKRLSDRGINLTADEMRGIKEAVDKAQAKGCRDSLVVLDRVALVVSVKNQTVITAVDAGHMKDNVFTNIDSAVFVRNN